MITGRMPFCSPTRTRGSSLLGILKAILKGRYLVPMDVSAELRDLISRIFVQDPASRITIEDIKAHPWFLTNLPSKALEMTSTWLQKKLPENQKMEEIKKLVFKAMRDPKRPTTHVP